MNKHTSPLRLALLALTVVSAFVTASCHHYDDYGYYRSGYRSGYGLGATVPVQYYVHGGVRYVCGTGPWYRNGVYHGPNRYYVVSGRKYLHGHGPWYKNGRYIVIHRHPGAGKRIHPPAAIVHAPGRTHIFKSPGRSTVIKTPPGHGVLKKRSMPGFPGTSASRKGVYHSSPGWKSSSPFGKGRNVLNRGRRW